MRVNAKAKSSAVSAVGGRAAVWHHPGQESYIGSNTDILPMIPFVDQGLTCP